MDFVKIGFIGAGEMAQAILKGLLKKHATNDFVIHGGNSKRAKIVAKENKIEYGANNLEVAQKSDVIFLAMLPQQLLTVSEEIREALPNKIVISILGGINLKQLEMALGHENVFILRALPNVNVKINMGMTSVIPNELLLQNVQQYRLIKNLINELGDIVELSEEQFGIFSALAGSGPAFISLVVDNLAQAGVKYGLKKEVAVTIVNQMILGTTSKIKIENILPRSLAEQVASPGGSTIAGILAMEEAGLGISLVKGIDATYLKDQQAGENK